MFSALHSSHSPSAPPGPTLKPWNLPGLSFLIWARLEPAGTVLARGQTLSRNLQLFSVPFLGPSGWLTGPLNRAMPLQS